MADYIQLGNLFASWYKNFYAQAQIEQSVRINLLLLFKEILTIKNKTLNNVLFTIPSSSNKQSLSYH